MVNSGNLFGPAAQSFCTFASTSVDCSSASAPSHIMTTARLATHKNNSTFLIVRRTPNKNGHSESGGGGGGTNGTDPASRAGPKGAAASSWDQGKLAGPGNAAPAARAVGSSPVPSSIFGMPNRRRKNVLKILKVLKVLHLMVQTRPSHSHQYTI